MAAPDEPKPLGAGDAVSSQQPSVVKSPTSPSLAVALSRFEFEAGKGNEGTKILMVEWDATVSASEQDSTSGMEATEMGDWNISWEGKSAVLGVRDSDTGDAGSLHRLYFLLPPGAHIPTMVSITRSGKDGNLKANKGPVLRTKPMPAIFPAELSGGREAGRLGVLHTLWAKRRLAELQDEIAREMRANGESVGLEMALRDRQWIVDHFGLSPGDGVPRATKLHIPESDLATRGSASPRSPVGGRLGEKLRGLKLATSPAELAAVPVPKSSLSQQLPLTSAAAVPRSTPNDIRVASLNAIVGSGAPPVAQEDGTEEQLFALPMSPRSPEMKRSPFSLL